MKKRLLVGRIMGGLAVGAAVLNWFTVIILLLTGSTIWNSERLFGQLWQPISTALIFTLLFSFVYFILFLVAVRSNYVSLTRIVRQLVVGSFIFQFGLIAARIVYLIYFDTGWTFYTPN